MTKAKVLYINQFKPISQNCVFCNSALDLRLFKNKIICTECFMAIRNIYRDSLSEEKTNPVTNTNDFTTGENIIKVL